MDKKIEDLTSFKEMDFMLLNCIAHELDKYHNKVFGPYGITGKQAAILSFMSFNSNNKLTQRDFEQEFDLRPSTINSVLNNLEAGGFVTRTVSKTDGRAKIVTAEQKGRELFDVIIGSMQRQNDLVIKGFSQAEQQQLHSFLHRIVDNIHNTREGAI